MPKIELDPGAWPRFEQFVRQAAKVGPKHRDASKPKRHNPHKRRTASDKQMWNPKFC
jgi:hypothetical protein